MAPLLQARHVRKSFGSVDAIRDATLEASPGEVVGLVGDNGAGKSTFIKILSGDLQPDGGELMFDGRQHRPHSPRDARKVGIETVYQDLGLCEHLSVARNLFLGREITYGWTSVLNEGQMTELAEQHLESLSLRGVRGDAVVAGLSGGQRQAVAVAKAVAFEPRLLILDEPTAALGIREVETVLDVIRKVRSRGVAVVLITHRMQDLFAVCDRLVVMYDGRTIGELVTAQTSLDEIVRYMDGEATAPDISSLGEEPAP
jgi:simple sugar transport system ATP-binding protein